MNVTFLLIIFGLSAFIVSASMPLLIACLKRQRLMDIPNERSSHTKAIPRGAGWIVAGLPLVYLLIFISMSFSWSIFGFASALMLLMGVSAIDDKISLSAKMRLLIQMIAVGLCIFTLPSDVRVLELIPFEIERIFLFFGMIWLINLTNFIDGINGITGVNMLTTSIGFIILAPFVPFIGLIGAVIGGAALGFLFWNVPKAKIFMGDVGSIPLGVWVGYGLIYVASTYGITTAFLLYAYPMLDATYTLIKRGVRREKIWHAHNEHFYQKSVQNGRGHFTTSLWIGFFNLACILLALIGVQIITFKAIAIVLTLLGFALITRFFTSLPPQSNAILLVINEASYFFSHRLSLAKALQSKGYDVHIAAPEIDGDLAKQFKDLNFTPHAFLDGHDKKAHLKSVVTLDRIIKKIDPQLVHLVTLKSSLRWFLQLFLGHRRPAIHIIAGFGQLSFDHWHARVARFIILAMVWVLSWTTRSIFVTQNPRDYDRMANIPFINKKALTMIAGSGVDTDFFTPRAKINKKANLQIGTATRRLKSKGLVKLAQLGQYTKHNDLSIDLHVASTPVIDTHWDAIHEKVWEQWVTSDLFKDHGSIHDVQSFLHDLDVFVYLSTSGEGLAKSLLEAGACGLPIITTDHAGCREAVIEEETGFIIPIDANLEHIVQKLQIFVNNPKLLNEMGKASRNHIVNNFSDKIVIEKMLALYAQLIKSLHVQKT